MWRPTIAGRYRDEDLDIYNATEWVHRRKHEHRWNWWYDGTALRQESTVTDVRDTSQKNLLFPLGINPIASFCRVHRNVLIGMTEDYLDMPAHLVFRPRREEERDEAERAQEFVDDVWYDSDGASLLFEAALRVQVDGGRMFLVSWEPRNDLLRHKIKVKTFPPSAVSVVYDHCNFFDLLEARIAYMLDADVARIKYGVDVDENESHVLYMEYWTKEFFRITVNGYIPSVDGFLFAGENRYGTVPMVYCRHYRDGTFWGTSHVPDLIELTKEKNGRMADLGEAVNETTHPMMFIRNIYKNPRMVPVQTDGQGNVMREAVHIGNAKNLPHSKEPDVDYARPPDVTSATVTTVKMLDAELRHQADIAPVAMGDDDTASGRITGPVTSYRLWPTMAHCQAERVEMSATLKHVARVILTIANVNEPLYEEMVDETPGVTEDMIRLRSDIQWPPQIPIQTTERTQELTMRLQAGGISLETYLERLGEQDVAGEMERIEAGQLRGIEMKRAMSEPEEEEEQKDEE